MNPTTSEVDIEIAMGLVKLHKDCFSGVSKDELRLGFLFVDRERGIMLHVKPENRRKIYGVVIPFGAYQITHIAASQKGIAYNYLKEFLVWSGNAPIWLFVKVDNKRAIEFYERWGFTKKNIAQFKTFSSYIMVRD